MLHREGDTLRRSAISILRMSPADSRPADGGDERRKVAYTTAKGLNRRMGEARGQEIEWTNASKPS